MPTVSRTFSLTYAGVTVGGSSDYYLLHGDPPFRIRKSYDRLTVEAYVVCRSTTVADFTTRADALEVAFRTPAGDLSYTFGSSTTSWSHSSNTGMSAKPEIEKVGDAGFDSDRSRLYKVSVTVVLPADNGAYAGLREGEIAVSTEANGRRTATLSGTVTALSSNSASAQYAVAVAAMVTAVTSALSATMEAVEPSSYTYDDRNKVARFTHTLREIIFDQSAGGTNHSSIKNQQLTVERGEEYPGDHDGNAPPARVTVTYSCDVDKSVTTDLETLFSGTIKPWIVTQARNVADAGSLAMTEIRPSYDRANNRISASVVMLAVLASTWGRRVTSETEEETGVRLVPVHNGNPSARKKYETWTTRRLTIRESIVRLSASSSSAGGGGAGGGVQGFFGAFPNGGGSLGQINVGGQSLSGGLGFFGFGTGSGDQRSQLGQLNIGGSPVARPQQSAGGSTGLGGVTIPKGFELIRRRRRSFPSVVGSPDYRFATSTEESEEVYEYADIVAPASGGGGGGGSVIGTGIR